VAAPLDPVGLFRVLAAHRVDYVLIGGMAAVLHGSPAATGDADIVPARTADNLARLAAALTDLHARIRSLAEPDGLAFEPHPELLSSMAMLNLTTRCGDLDLTVMPSGTGGYDELLPGAIRFDIDGIEVAVASLDDVIRSKRAADRPKDRAMLPLLEALRDEIDRR
jgi:hypothetical protein